MKKLFLLTITSLLIFGCSSDDGSTNTQPKKIVRRSYTGNPNEVIQRYLFSNGKLESIKFYNSSDFFKGSINYEYFSNGLLHNITKSNGGYLHSFIYDNQERIMHMKYENSQLDEAYYVNYTYNNDNTITAESFGTTQGVKTYYLNSNNLIYKEVSEGTTYEVIFDGYNAISGSYGTFISRSFEYSDTDLQFNTDYFTGGYASNGVLMYNSLYGNETASANKYLIKEIGNDTFKHEYTFDGNGRPIIRLDYKNDNLTDEFKYEY
ncbi:hypothetical protein [Flavobacterium litorale]|uniref:DUF4595 domain-containing protein n=1 Tax=Flavobacterium litorale TaxID=2856519 RepID=A0ABX8VC13_9FLAO|nr:hypothetical protein [Flavobacterium litorale]QYJ68171.1 hypothetical protein K1I41_11685 [Flavobacterium litorale]